MLVASCHCGAVEIEIDRRPRTLTQCTCSVCRRYGALWIYRTRKTARVVRGANAESAYLWNDKVMEFYHCNGCGCVTRYESIEKADDSRIAVNARMLAPQEIEDARIRIFDGADSWKFLD